MLNKFHPYHMVTISPWPVISSLMIWNMVSTSTTTMVTKNGSKELIMCTMLVGMLSAMWWNDTIKESKKEGEHQKKVSKGLKMGMIMFIMSEVMFFVSFFWCYFHSGMSPNLEVGQMWPPKSINSFEPTNVPLMNTLILISSGASITWAHHNLIANKYDKAVKSMIITCMLGLYFTGLQWMEYKQGEFSMGDSSYGSIFFMATGFHGIHVIIGTTFLTVTLMNMYMMSISKQHHNSFEMAAWYWHFVDVVWLFLYLSIYWWGK